MIFIKMLKGHKEARINNNIHFMTKAHKSTTLYVQQDAGGHFYISSFM